MLIQVHVFGELKGVVQFKNVLIIYSTHPHVIQDIYVFLSSVKVFEENIPGFFYGLQRLSDRKH